MMQVIQWCVMVGVDDAGNTMVGVDDAGNTMVCYGGGG